MMRPAKNKVGQLWLRSRDMMTSVESQEEMGFQGLRNQAKRIAIVTRMDNRQRSHRSGLSCVRPRTTISSNKHKGTNTLKQATILYKNYKKKISSMVYEGSQISKTNIAQSTNKTTNNIQGLLGQYSRYQKMTKQQLIQKLISLQYLANNIFKKNKHLQEQLRQKNMGQQELLKGYFDIMH